MEDRALILKGGGHVSLNEWGKQSVWQSLKAQAGKARMRAEQQQPAEGNCVRTLHPREPGFRNAELSVRKADE
jgi:hypothetical protein